MVLNVYVVGAVTGLRAIPDMAEMTEVRVPRRGTGLTVGILADQSVN